MTIMMNYIAAGLLAYLLTTTVFQRPGRTDPISPIVDWNATFPRLEGAQLHLGFLVALLAAVGGLVAARPVDHRLRHPRGRRQPARRGHRRDERGPDHGDHHGRSPARWPGWPESRRPSARRASGVPVPLSAGIVGSIGFDAITVALLGRSKPLGIVLAGLLFGALHAGGLAMQSVAQTPLTLTTVLQALIVLFVAAPGAGHRSWCRSSRRARPEASAPSGGRSGVSATDRPRPRPRRPAPPASSRPRSVGSGSPPAC